MNLEHDGNEFRASKIMLKIGSATESELPITLKVGGDDFTIRTLDQAKTFSLGMLAALEGKCREDEILHKEQEEDDEC